MALSERVQTVWEWNGEETSITTHAFEGDGGNMEDDGRRALVAESFDAQWLDMRERFTSLIRPVRMRFYALPGGGEALETIDLDGVYGNGGSDRQAPQVASSVTLITTSRRHWGRFYLPGPGPAQLNSTGQWSTGFVDDLAGQVKDWFNTLRADADPVIPMVASNDGLTLRTVLQVRCDSVPDVIRRRRPKPTLYRKTETLT